MQEQSDSVRTGRRLRVTTPQEQEEFVRLTKQLLDGVMKIDELRAELGYDDEDQFRHAMESGRVTTERLTRLRELTHARLPDLMQQKQEELERQTQERMERLAAQFRRDAKQAEAKRSTESQAASKPTSQRNGESTSRGKTETEMARGRRKEYLQPKQHERLREQIEHLWAVDKRFRNWSLLAKAAGLSSGQAVKRAYEVNSSLATLQNIETFARLHAGFGSKATKALKAGIAVEDLQAHLMAGRDGGAGSTEDGAGAAEERRPAKSARPTVTHDDLGDTPPDVDFESLAEAGSAIDTEVKRLWLVARFMGQMAARRDTMPRFVREAARESREHVLRAIAQWMPLPEAEKLLERDEAERRERETNTGDVGASGTASPAGVTTS